MQHGLESRLFLPKILKLENEVIELQMALEKEQNRSNHVKTQLVQMNTEHKELANEYIVLKTNHIQLTAENQQQVRVYAILGPIVQSPTKLIPD